MAQWLFDLVGGAEHPLEPIVDVGTGGGQYLTALGGGRRLGMDLSLGMLTSLASSAPELPLVQADAQQLPLASALAGTVLANHMLYHVPDIDLAISELYRAVRADGVVVVVTNGAGHLGQLTALRDRAIGHLAGQPFHLETSAKRFTLEEGVELLSRYFPRVECHHRRAELIVPGAEPVMRHLASAVGLAPSLPDGVSFDAMLAAAEPLVREVVDTDGCFRVDVHAGAFVCRK